MTRVNKTVRLAYETKLWIDELINYKELELREQMNDGLIQNLEKKLFDISPNVLNGISCNIVLKVTSGSVIEQAYRNTKHYSLEDWSKIQKLMKRKLSEVDFSEETTVTPRLYIDDEILSELETYQDTWRSKEPGKRLIRLSYVIKLVVFAEYYSKVEGKNI
ncbi:hypothetical protein DSM25_04680 [Enterococcus faecalis]|uniref:hypothetical protein n=1 Tax=Enterococcus TaxID=1350 RepID=UPI000CF0F9A9|nr:hypothetical protein [Enterococcus faecalis]EGO9794990.1 hypothetical protein [Enterococcus faecalis]EIB6819201.1 hypothetical protein [Enterococcus faecalis]EKA3598263.1 hypothetical protein [Enterococcus faecalis]NSU88740.1 hypothetical protein [Enterococcus faecalis]PQD12418.1 hypothetical protein CUM65_01400 [Enterococcus faecalis]